MFFPEANTMTSLSFVCFFFFFCAFLPRDPCHGSYILIWRSYDWEDCWPTYMSRVSIYFDAWREWKIQDMCHPQCSAFLCAVNCCRVLILPPLVFFLGLRISACSRDSLCSPFLVTREPCLCFSIVNPSVHPQHPFFSSSFLSKILKFQSFIPKVSCLMRIYIYIYIYIYKYIYIYIYVGSIK